MTQEKTPQEYLEELIFKGSTTKVINLLDGKLVAEITNLTADKQLAIDEHMSKVTGTNALILHTYQLWILSYTLKSLNSKRNLTPEEWFGTLKEQPSVLVDKLMAEQAGFETQLREVLNNVETKENFSAPTSTD